MIVDNTKYNIPVKEVSIDNIHLGHIHPFSDVLIYSAGDRYSDIKMVINDKPNLLPDAIQNIIEYCKENQYKALYIDKYMYGIAQLKPDSYWAELGFRPDENPDLLYLSIDTL